jgi:UDP-glucose 4-epimerase
LITWVIGGGGLLGRAIRQQSGDLFSATVIPWARPDAARDILKQDLVRFTSEVANGPWGIVWAAGAATVATSATDADRELSTFGSLCEAIRDAPPAGHGAVFVTSSAGGVYAGSLHPPFDAATAPVAVSAYGELKLAQEEAAIRALSRACPLVIGRFSNLYGPGQNLEKLQGLVSRLALAAATQRPINIFVSLDTIRDYVYVDDAAAAAVRDLHTQARRGSAEPVISVIASGEPTTVGQLIRTVGQVTKRRVPVALGNHASASGQVPDLRLIPSDPTIARTPLPAGVRRVYLDILDRLQHRPLSA